MTLPRTYDEAKALIGEEDGDMTKHPGSVAKRCQELVDLKQHVFWSIQEAVAPMLSRLHAANALLSDADPGQLVKAFLDQDAMADHVLTGAPYVWPQPTDLSEDWKLTVTHSYWDGSGSFPEDRSLEEILEKMSPADSTPKK